MISGDHTSKTGKGCADLSFNRERTVWGCRVSGEVIISFDFLDFNDPDYEAKSKARKEAADIAIAKHTAECKGS